MTQEEYYRNYKKFDKLPYQEQIDSLNSFIEQDRKHWNDIYKNGCHDPNWEDGTNLNLVRNHIIYWLIKLRDIDQSDHQLSLFDLINDREYGSWKDDKRLPPEVPNDYMAKDRIMRGKLVKATV